MSNRPKSPSEISKKVKSKYLHSIEELSKNRVSLTKVHFTYHLGVCLLVIGQEKVQGAIWGGRHCCLAPKFASREDARFRMSGCL